MTRLKRRRSDRSGRAPLPSPGRPAVAGRDELRRFWAAIALGLSSEDAAAGANIPQAVGGRWFRKADATSNVRDVGEAVVGQISFVCRTRGDRALTSTRL